MSISRGYLNEDYRVFHSSDRRDMDFMSHSHDFHKIVFCLSGRVDYTMEGTTYRLREGDILSVPEHQIHRSVMTADETYERIVLWISAAFLRRFDEPALLRPFEPAGEGHSFLLRPGPRRREVLLDRLSGLEKYAGASEPGHGLMADTYLLQFLLELNRIMGESGGEAGIVRPDPLLQSLLDHINGHLSEDLSVEALARVFYISPSHLMHTFKENTGYTVHRYITEKRLLRAADLLMKGNSVAVTAELSGFTDYSTFLKAFRRFFGVAPGTWRARRTGTD